MKTFSDHFKGLFVPIFTKDFIDRSALLVNNLGIENAVDLELRLFRYVPLHRLNLNRIVILVGRKGPSDCKPTIDLGYVLYIKECLLVLRDIRRLENDLFLTEFDIRVLDDH